MALVVVVHEDTGGQRFVVQHVSHDGTVEDVSDQFEVHLMAVEDDRGTVAGFLIGRWVDAPAQSGDHVQFDPATPSRS